MPNTLTFAQLNLFVTQVKPWATDQRLDRFKYVWLQGTDTRLVGTATDTFIAFRIAQEYQTSSTTELNGATTRNVRAEPFRAAVDGAQLLAALRALKAYKLRPNAHVDVLLDGLDLVLSAGPATQRVAAYSEETADPDVAWWLRKVNDLLGATPNPGPMPAGFDLRLLRKLPCTTKDEQANHVQVIPQGNAKPVHIYAADLAWQAVLMPLRTAKATDTDHEDHALHWRAIHC